MQSLNPSCNFFLLGIVYCTETSPVKKPAAEYESGTAAGSYRGVGMCFTLISVLCLYQSLDECMSYVKAVGAANASFE